MLGDLVAVEFECPAKTAVEKGGVLGLIEGLKAVSDLYCIGSGVFEGGNPAFASDLSLLEKDPYGEGWLYEWSGEPEPGWLDAKAYRELVGVATQRLPCA